MYSGRHYRKILKMITKHWRLSKRLDPHDRYRFIQPSIFEFHSLHPDHFGRLYLVPRTSLCIFNLPTHEGLLLRNGVSQPLHHQYKSALWNRSRRRFIVYHRTAIPSASNRTEWSGSYKSRANDTSLVRICTQRVILNLVFLFFMAFKLIDGIFF